MEMEAGRGEKGDNNNNNIIISEEMMMSSTTTSVDWRGKPSNPIKHGGMKAAVFVLGTYFILIFLSSSSCCFVASSFYSFTCVVKSICQFSSFVVFS